MGFWSSFTKGIGSVLNPTSMFDLGDNGNAALDFLDPGNTFHQGSADRLANQQFNLQASIAKKNYDEQKRMNDWNIKMQEDAYAYQQQLNEQQRQDNLHAVENRVADLKAAGLSPTLAAGSAANVTPVHAGSAPQGVAPQMATPSDIKVQQAMFKAQLEKDYMQLAVGMLGNFADISRTKAETELIKAQKDRYVAETPIELRLKGIEQEIADSTVKFQIKQKVQETEINELRKINDGLTNMLLQKENGIKAYEVVTKSEEAKAASQYYQSRNEKLQQEVVDKTIANQMADFLNKTSNELGVPHEMMSSKFKDVNSWMLYGKKSAQDRAKYDSGVDKEPNVLKRWFGNFKNWHSPSLLYR